MNEAAIVKLRPQRLCIKDLLKKCKRTKRNYIILKGIKKTSKYCREIVYLIAYDENVRTLENIFKCNKEVRIAKANRCKYSYFDFATWDILRISNGQVTGSSMNMVNDETNYYVYDVVN